MKRTPGVNIVLFTSSFAVVKSAIHMLISPGYLMRFTPKVRWVRYGSYFGGRKFTTIHPFVTYFRQFSGIALCCIKTIVSVLFTLPPIPCASRPISFAKDFIHTGIY